MISSLKRERGHSGFRLRCHGLALIPRVGWSIFTIIWSVETLFPDDVVDTTAGHIF